MKLLKNKLVCAALVFLAAFLAYSNAIMPSFHWEDEYLVKENVHIRKLSNLPVFFKPGYINVYESGAGQRYRPLRTVTLALDYALWGEDARGYHLTNVLLHAGASVLLLLFCLTLTGDGLLALAAALLFALHPAHSESVVWIKNRTDLLCAVFYFGSLAAFAGALRGGRAWLYAASALLFVPALLAKEMALTLPLALTVLLALLNLEAGRDWKEGWTRLIPAYALLAVYLFFREGGMGGGAFTGSALQKAALMANAAGEYLKILAWPVSLSLDRPLPAMPAAAVNMAAALCFAALLPVLLLRRERGGAFWLLLFWILYVPVSNVVFIEGRPLAEQRLYLPSAAFCALLGWALSSVVRAGGGRARSALAAAALLALFWGGRTMLRNSDWRSETLIWEKTLAFAPSARAYNNLAVAQLREKRCSEAAESAGRSLGLDPSYVDAHNTLGAVYHELGLYDKSIASFENAVRYSGGGAYKSLMNLATLYSLKGDDAKALDLYREVLKMAPWLDAAFYNMGLTLTRLQRRDEAAAAFTEAIALNPYNRQAYLMLARYLAAKGDKKGAGRVYSGLLRIDPANQEAAAGAAAAN